MSHWCELCQMEHSSTSCFHPGNDMRRRAEAAEAALVAANERVKRLEAFAHDMRQRYPLSPHIQAEALAALDKAKETSDEC